MDEAYSKERMDRRSFLRALGGLAAVCSGSAKLHAAVKEEKPYTKAQQNYGPIEDDSPSGSSFLT